MQEKYLLHSFLFHIVCKLLEGSNIFNTSKQFETLSNTIMKEYILYRLQNKPKYMPQVSICFSTHHDM